jgi:hypothetical protein
MFIVTASTEKSTQHDNAIVFSTLANSITDAKAEYKEIGGEIENLEWRAQALEGHKAKSAHDSAKDSAADAKAAKK